VSTGGEMGTFPGWLISHGGKEGKTSPHGKGGSPKGGRIFVETLQNRGGPRVFKKRWPSGTGRIYNHAVD